MQPELETTDSFETLKLDKRILSALNEIGYETPTEIQAAAIPLALAGEDLIANAQTGTGKTAAFALPLLQRMIENSPPSDKKPDPKRPPRRHVKALILSPTRELAQQIEENLKLYSKELPFRTVGVVGGLPIKRQIQVLKKGADIVVATPGRLLDLMGRNAIRLFKVEYFVLDEADRMLDMGFVDDVLEIARCVKKKRQTLLFSATTSPDVQRLSRRLLKDPQKVAASPPQTVADNIVNRLFLVEKINKRNLLIDIVKDPEIKKGLVFTSTKSEANLLASVLSRKDIEADAIHSDKDQRARQKVLKAFAEGDIRILCATDVLARGIDVDGITHVINFDLPREPEAFVHRIGRTARAGSSGIAISLCDQEEVSFLRAIEQITDQKLEVDDSHQYHSPLVQTMKDGASSGRRSRTGKPIRRRR